MFDSAHIGERKMTRLSTHFAAAIAALFVATTSILAVVQVPQDNAVLAATPATAAAGTTLA